MRVSKFLHSCVLVEKEGGRVLIDPGKFSFVDGRVTVERFDGVAAVLVTHSHPDHLDVEKLKAIAARTSAEIHASSEIAAKLAPEGIQVRVFDEGTRRIAGFDVRAIPSPHEAILSPALPSNVAFLFDERLLHPGDSYASVLDSCRGVPLLALPIMAPWTTELGTAVFAERLAPKRALPIHDGYVKDFWLEARHANLGGHLRSKGIAYEPADEPGTAVEV
jgi:L-ascorbate metabolism protein UlaG (beta-lactamase superfamily)